MIWNESRITSFPFIHNYDIIASYPISSYGFWKRSALTNIKKDALKHNDK